MFGHQAGTVIGREFFVGLDLGKVRDPTALGVVERVELVGRWDAVAFAYRKEVELRLRWLGRLPLGLPYPEAEARTAALMGELRGEGARFEVVVDATGVGVPVLDYMRRGALKEMNVRGVMIHAGQTERQENGLEYVPKRNLITGLQVLLEYGELKIARDMEGVEVLRKELAEMQVKVSPTGSEQFGAWREGSHDDLVLAVALACWAARKKYPALGKVEYWIGHR